MEFFRIVSIPRSSAACVVALRRTGMPAFRAGHGDAAAHDARARDSDFLDRVRLNLWI
jgi:hypothetical protein